MTAINGFYTCAIDLLPELANTRSQSQGLLIDQIRKSCNALIPHPTIHHSGQKHGHFWIWMVYCDKWDRWIVGFARLVYSLVTSNITGDDNIGMNVGFLRNALFTIFTIYEVMSRKISILWIVINSSPPSAAYIRQWIGSALVQIIACPLFGAKPLSKPKLCYCQLDH